jgi:hypothetical protein
MKRQRGLHTAPPISFSDNSPRYLRTIDPVAPGAFCGTAGPFITSAKTSGGATSYQAHGPTGPVELQDHVHLVRFRNIWFVPSPIQKHLRNLLTQVPENQRF